MSAVAEPGRTCWGFIWVAGVLAGASLSMMVVDVHLDFYPACTSSWMLCNEMSMPLLMVAVVAEPSIGHSIEIPGGMAESVDSLGASCRIRSLTPATLSMAAATGLPELTKQWLRQVSQPYADQSRTFADVEAALVTFPTLKPKTDVYSARRVHYNN